MIFHENRLLADDSHVNIIPYFCQKLGKMSQNLSSAAVVIGALRVNSFPTYGYFCHLLITFANSLDPGQALPCKLQMSAYNTNSFLASCDFCHLLKPLQTVWTQIRPNKMLGVI